MTEAKQFKCESCGAPIKAQPVGGAVKCEFCGSVIVIEKEKQQPIIPTQEIDFAKIAGQATQIISAVGQNLPLERPRRAIRTFIGCLVLLIVLPVVVSISVALCGSFKLFEPMLKMVAKNTWDGKSTLYCKSGDSINLMNKKANIVGSPAIVAEGSCKLTCTNCDIKGTMAITVEDNAEVNCLNCELKGDEVGVLVDMNGRFSIVNGSIVGKGTAVRAEANGKFEATSVDINGNVGISASDHSNVTYHGGSIEAAGNAIEQKNNAKLEFMSNVKVTGGIQAQHRDRIEGLQ